MKNRKRESCTSGTVRDEDGNVLIYSARPQRRFHTRQQPASATGQGTKSRKVERRGCGWRLYVADCLANKHILLSSEENGEPVLALGA